MRFHDLKHSIQSWTGFQILISNQIPIIKTKVGYLDCIDAPASDMSTIYTVNIIQNCHYISNLGAQEFFEPDVNINVPKVIIFFPGQYFLNITFYFLLL